jgi:hypothetical protein
MASGAAAASPAATARESCVVRKHSCNKGGHLVDELDVRCVRCGAVTKKVVLRKWADHMAGPRAPVSEEELTAWRWDAAQEREYYYYNFECSDCADKI